MQHLIRRPFGVRTSKDAKESKTLVAEIDTTGVTEEMLLEMAIASLIIKVQQPLRNVDRYKKLRDGEVIRVKMVDHAPKGVRIDPMEYMKARIRNASTEEEKQAIIAELLQS